MTDWPWRLELGDCRHVMAMLPDECIDAVVCDPPYGLGFMGKTWDHSVPGPEYWRTALRVMKPGAHLVAMGGTRTAHRLACAIEDAGFELRDSIAWCYGSGFPKSLDVSKAIDRAAGAEREQIGSYSIGGNAGIPTKEKGGTYGVGVGTAPPIDVAITAPATDAAKQWAGWGTALKPAWETIVVATKPLALDGLCATLAQRIAGAVCRLRLCARGAGNDSASSRSASAEGFGSVQWDAVEGCNTPDALLDLTATWPFALAIPSGLSIALSWLNTLAVISIHGSTFTTETASSLTIDLQTLNCLPCPITPESIIEAATRVPGTGSSASLVESIFSAVRSRLEIIRAVSARGVATSTDGDDSSRLEQIILARKPLVGTVAANVERFGTGAINVDGCRVASEPIVYASGCGGGKNETNRMMGGNVENDARFREQRWENIAGRWPPNLLLSHSPECRDDCAPGCPVRVMGEQSGERPSAGNVNPTQGGHIFDGGNGIPQSVAEVSKGDTGSAARYFPQFELSELDAPFQYCAKASRPEREAGCDELPAKTAAEATNSKEGQARLDSPRTGAGRTAETVRNHHPTVKPVELMRWLCRLVTPPGGLILDPFCGSGSTGVGATAEGFRFFGIDKDPAYVAIASARIAHRVGDLGGLRPAEATPAPKHRAPQLKLF